MRMQPRRFRNSQYLSALVFLSSLPGGSLMESPHFQNQRNITAEPGQNVTLPCRAPDSEPVVAVEWSRADLGYQYVFLFRNDQIDLEHQHPSFKNRVDLKDKELKDGDGSLVLRNAKTGDDGTYQCQVVQKTKNRNSRTIVIINLAVLPPPGEPDGGSNKTPHTWGISVVVVGVVFVLVCFSAVGLIFMKC